MNTVLISILGGVIPSLVWLVFWLLEDRCQPEPRLRIIGTFLAGMAAVLVVLPIETYFSPLVGGVVLLLIWASAEEIFKFGAAAVFGLGSRAYDEPLDAVIYLTTAALGFAAGENALYLYNSLSTSAVGATLLTGDLRFVGATLLHVLASATIGLMMATFFFASPLARLGGIFAGVILAIALHTAFNFFILWIGGASALMIFLPVWISIIVLLALTERMKNPARDYC